MTGIGIDTGGTYTDAVIYDLETREIKASAKSLTTREDLKKGISKALRRLPEDALRKAEALALSTTLATNACVENKGGRAKLILIGVSEKTFDEVGKDYGIENREDVYFLDCIISNVEGNGTEPDWEQFEKEVPELIKNCQGISIVQLFSMKFAGNYEKKARSIIREFFDGPVVLGKDLFSDLNAIKRGAGALLNARLIPVIHDFLEAVKEVFKGYGVEVPPVIVRSDGSLMNEGMAAERPVETLLCGPAASIIGAMHLAKEQNAMIVDMGGTTTDIAIIENGEARKVSDGIHIGNWKTFVKGLFVDTFGLGGDTAVHYTSLGKLYLENYRIVPISNLAAKYPEVVLKLKKLLAGGRRDNFYLHEFLILIRSPRENEVYNDQEREICRILENGPLMLLETADALGKDLYNVHTERLEREGLIIRAGFTPTDAMAIKGDYENLDSEAAMLAARYIEGFTKIPAEEFADAVYDLVMKRLYCNLVRIFLQTGEKAFAGQELDGQLEKLIELSYMQKAEELRAGEEKAGVVSGNANRLFTDFHTSAVLVGVGAPTHVFLEPVAKMLGTKAVNPPHAAVANAVGAIVGNVTATVEAEISPVYTGGGVEGYNVLFADEQQWFEEYEEAKKGMEIRGSELAREEAYRRGAKGELIITVSGDQQVVATVADDIPLPEKYEITATGKIQ